MTIAAAEQFIQRSVNDPELVCQINLASDSAEIINILSGLGLLFNHEEFERAYFNVLTWCQNPEQAEAVKGVKMWWDCLGFCLGQPETR